MTVRSFIAYTFSFRASNPSVITQCLQVTLDGAVLQAWMSDDATAPGVASEPDMQLHSLRMFATNDYLGLSTHVRVRQAAADAAIRYGSGDTVLGICSGNCAAAP